MFHGDKLKDARKRAGYTLVGLSKALKEEYGHQVVDFTTLSSWEINPSSRPSRAKIEKVCRFLGVSLEELFDAEDCIIVGADLFKDISGMELIGKLVQVYLRNPNDERISQIKDILY